MEKHDTDIMDDYTATLERLQKGIETMDCGYRLSAMESVRREDLYNVLVFERLQRKAAEVVRFYDSCRGDWNQVLHMMLFASMGGKENKEAFVRLAERVPCHVCFRERGDRSNVEALLLGASGLLFEQRGFYDDYIIDLNRRYDHLSNKLSIVNSMGRGDWNLKTYPAGNPILRIVQLATLVCSDKCNLGNVLDCRTVDDVYALFGAEASEYWTTHYLPGTRSDLMPKRIGRTKANLIGINMVVPLMFAYGTTERKEPMKSAAMELLDMIPPESNSIVNQWSGCGVGFRSAYVTQAVLQLGNEYCKQRRCAECRIGRNELRKGSRQPIL